MDITDRLKGEQKLQQDDYGRGLQVLDDAVEHIDELRDENDRLRLKFDEALVAIREYCDFHQVETPAFNRLLGRRDLPVSGDHDEVPNGEGNGPR